MNLPITILKDKALAAGHKQAETRELVPCKNCSKPFPKNRSWQQYCSNKCRNDYNQSLKDTELVVEQEELIRLRALAEEQALTILNLELALSSRDSEDDELAALDRELGLT